MPASASASRCALARFQSAHLLGARTFPTLVLFLGRSPHLPRSLTLRCSDTSSFGARQRRRSRFRDRLAAFMFALASNAPPLGVSFTRGSRLCFTLFGLHGRLRLSTFTSCPPPSAHVRSLVFRSVGVVFAFSVPASDFTFRRSRRRSRFGSRRRPFTLCGRAHVHLTAFMIASTSSERPSTFSSAFTTCLAPCEASDRVHLRVVV